MVAGSLPAAGAKNFGLQRVSFDCSRLQTTLFLSTNTLAWLNHRAPAVRLRLALKAVSPGIGCGDLHGASSLVISQCPTIWR